MPAFVACVGIIRWPASSNSNPVSRWSDLLRTTVRCDHWARDFCRTCLKQRTVHNRRLLARQDLILVFDLADIEVVAQQIVQRATARTGSHRASLPWRA